MEEEERIEFEELDAKQEKRWNRLRYMVKDNLKAKFEKLLKEYVDGEIELEGYCGE